jgi:hypothetical protein
MQQADHVQHGTWLDERYLPRELRRSPKRLERRVKLQFARPDRRSAAE